MKVEEILKAQLNLEYSVEYIRNPELENGHLIRIRKWALD